MQLDPRALLAFAAIYEEGSVTRAAVRLNITQQGLSGILSRLRGVFGDPLFVRIPHGVSPTPFCDATYPKIIAAINSLKTLTEVEAVTPQTIDSTFYVAANDFALSVIIPPLFRHLRSVAPNLRLAVVPLQVEVLNDQMRRGQIDFALTVPEFLPDSAYSSNLFSDLYKCAFHKGHPMAAKKLTIEEFCKVEHLLVAPNGESMRSSVDDILKRSGQKRNVGITVPSFLVARSLLQTSDLLGLLPSRLLDDHADTLFVTDPPFHIPSFDIVCAWSERSNADPFNTWLREVLRMLFGE